MFRNIRFSLARLLLGRPYSVGMCGNRMWEVRQFGGLELTVTLRNTLEPDGYSREELVEMLERVRRHETRMGWRAPEPETPHNENDLRRMN